MESARLDITHHKRLSRADLDAIESLANEVDIHSVARTEKSLLIGKMLTKSMDLTSTKEVRQRVATSEFYGYLTTTFKHVVVRHHDEPGQLVKFV